MLHFAQPAHNPQAPLGFISFGRIADEETKFGLGFDEAIELLRSEEYTVLKNIRIRGNSARHE